MIRADFTKKTPQTFRLAILADTHIGNIGCSEKAIEKAVKQIASDNRCYWLFLGDGCETIFLGDKRFDPQVHVGKYELLQAQISTWVDLFAPILPRCLAYIGGNHEFRVRHIDNVPNRVKEKVELKYGVDILCDNFTIKAKFSDNFRLYATHGSGSVNSMAGDRRQMEFNDAIRVKRKLRHLAGDCNVMVMAHIHKLRIMAPAEDLCLVGDDKLKEAYPDDYVSQTGAINEDSRWFCSTGSFLKSQMDGVTLYSEVAMYPPNEMGYILIEVEKGRVKQVHKVKLINLGE